MSDTNGITEIPDAVCASGVKTILCSAVSEMWWPTTIVKIFLTQVEETFDDYENAVCFELWKQVTKTASKPIFVLV